MTIEIASVPQKRVFEELESSRRGLTSNEATTRLEKFGENKIPEVKGTPLILKFLANFYHTFAILLWVSAVLSFVAQLKELGYAIIGVIVINALFSFWQEFKAEKATEALRQLIPLNAKVMRNGEIQQVLAAELVPGDLIIMEEGDSISADARVVEEFELRTNNATFTGESEPVKRTADPVSGKDMGDIELPNLVFSGTSVASGSGRAVVYATGMETQFGHIASLTQSVAAELSPLQKEVQRIALVVAIIAVLVGGVLFVVGSAIAKLTLVASALFAVGMIVANVPEGLLPTLSLALAAAVQKMVRENALVKKLSAVETLGSATVICTDKTGTLTQNEMTVREVWSSGDQLGVEGVGYNPEGSFTENNSMVDPELVRQRLSLLFKAGSYANNAKLNPPKDDQVLWTILGDPTEAALLVTAMKAGFDYSEGTTIEPRIYELPFESVRKRMTSIHKVYDVATFPASGSPVLKGNVKADVVAYTKGAPKEVLSLCTKIWVNGEVKDLSDTQRQQIIEENDAFAKQALRVLACAYRVLPGTSDKYTVEDVEQDLVFVGLQAMMDPPRPEVAAAVEQCRAAHIRIIMITGDYGLTAESIARRVGIVKERDARIITGQELENMTEDELKTALKAGEVIFARVSPDHKLKIAATLKDMGHVVAMTGDGVNDAPALKKADIGVAMGIAGTDVAKEAAEVILLDDNFATIVNAIAEGRAVYDNIKKFIVYIFAHLGPEAVPFVMFVLFRGLPLPITPMQIIAIDLGTETLPALGLGVEPAEPDIMQRPPRSKKENLLSTGVLLRAYVYLGVIESALVVAAYFFTLYTEGWHPGSSMSIAIGSPLQLKASTMAFLAIVATQVGVVFACKTNRESVFRVGFFNNNWILWGVVFETLLTAFLIYFPPVAKFFGMAPLQLKEWLFVLPFPFIVFFAEEIRKIFARRMSRNKPILAPEAENV